MNFAVRNIMAKLFMKLCGLLPIDERKVVIKSFRGLYYNDNPRAIYEEFYKKCPDYHFIWIMENTNIRISGATVVKHASLAEIYHLATAKVWIDNK